MTDSEIFRAVVVVILVGIFVARRAGFFDWIKEQKADKKKEQEKQVRLEERQELARKQQKKKELKKKQTAEILRRSVQGLEPHSMEIGGLDVWYLIGGPENGPRVLLLHGFAGDKENWAEVGAELVEKGYRVIAPDLPGFGQSTKNAEQPYDVTTQVKRIRGFAHSLQLGRFHIVGCGIGGTIAAGFAYSAADEIASLTLIEPFGVRVPYPSELDNWLAEQRNPLVIAGPAAYDNLLGFLFVHPPEMEEHVKQIRAEQAAEHRSFYLKMWKEIYHGERAKILDLLLPEMKVKTQVILGAGSKVVHAATAQAIQELLPTARVVVLEDCGHFPMVEKPAETLRTFLELAENVQ